MATHTMELNGTLGERGFGRAAIGRHGVAMRPGRGVLGLRLLGEVELLRDGERAALPPSRKTRALLAFLAATGKPHRRERLCAMFWNVPDDPRGALR